MTIKLRYFAPLLVAGAAAAAIAVAPGASAASVTTTVDSGSATTTQRPGHVAIQASQSSPRFTSAYLGSVLFSTFHLGRLGETQSNREAAEIGTFILLRGFRLFCRMAVRGMCST